MNWACYGKCGMVEVPVLPKEDKQESSFASFPTPAGIHQDVNFVNVFSRFKVGAPHSKYQWDEDWDQYCQGLNETGVRFEERSSFLPAELSLRALLKQLDQYKNVETDHTVRPDLVEGWLRDLLEPYCSGFRILTQEEAIYGVKDQYGVLEPLNLRSSPGEGLNKLASDKARLLDLHWDWVMELLAWDWQAIVVDGVIPMWFYKASEKDERRDFVRVFDHKTRLFMAECMIPVITTRRLYGDFIRRFMAAGKVLSFFSAAGMEVYYGHWDKFIRYLTGDLSIQELQSFDLPKFDKNQKHDWHFKNAKLISGFVNDQDYVGAIVRNCARVAYAPALLTITGGVFVRPCDNPSGQGGTIVWNTIGVERLIIEAWLRCDGDATAPGGGTDLSRFHRFVRNKIIGDDLIFTISPGSPFQVKHFVQVATEQGWPPEREGTGFLDDSHFAGRASVLSQIGHQDVFLPLINTDKILAVNEYRRGKRDVVKRLSRAYAAAELAFPCIFTDDAWLFVRLYDYYKMLRRDGLASSDVLYRAVALGLPNHERMWTLYTDRPCPIRELTQLVTKRYCKAEEGGASFVMGAGA